LWLERKSFQRTVSIVRRQDKSDHWKQIRYVIFDAPGLKEPFEARIEHVADCVRALNSKYVSALDHARCRSLDHLREELTRIEQLGGEGLMLRKPASLYESGRSITLLKVKTFHDEDAVVVDYVQGKGRHKGRVGALLVRLPNGTQFSVGTGLTDKQRENPPAKGSTITFRYQELSDGGVPRFPSFVRHRGDVSAVVIANPDTKPASPATSSSKPAAAKSKTPKTTAEESAADVRYFEFVEGNSSKFWEIRIAGTDVITRHGKIGTEGRETPKSFSDADAAKSFMAKQILAKTDKGYIEREPD
jgi:DNA ligase-1